MSTHTAVQQRIVVPPVAELVDSLAKSASAAVVNFERHSSRYVQEEPKQSSTAAPVTPSAWIQDAPTTSPLRKGGSFAIVVLVHAIVLYGISHIAPQLRTETPTPLQVVTVNVPQSDEDTPPPPVPVLRLPELNPPIEPIIDIAVVDSNAITVAARPAEPTTAATTATVGAPKVVSSVEYIREPRAKYPPAARALKQRGTVMLRAMIDSSGHAREVNVHHSSGHRLLDDTARDAVLNALFKPYMENGHSIPVYVFIPIEFGAAT